MRSARRSSGTIQAGSGAHFTPEDFSVVISKLPEGCPIVGGQAVAWWARKYGIKHEQNGKVESVTSADIDFWGSREDLKTLAVGLGRKPIFPKDYEMTVWVGAVQLEIEGEKTLAEFLHTIPGLDTNDPERASVRQEYKTAAVEKVIQVLSPVSLVFCKLHALRHFDQTNRDDELHLKVSLQACPRFITGLLEQREIRMALWNCERLLSATQLKPYHKMEAKYRFDFRSAIPIEAIRSAAKDPEQAEKDRTRLENFSKLRWARSG